MPRILVIGNGMAGMRTVEGILARGGGEFEITVVGDEPYGNYDRLALSRVLSGEAEESDILLNALPWYAENGIELLSGVRAKRIDRFAHRVRLAGRESLRYDKLVIATGGVPFVPDIAGMRVADRGFHQGVFTFRTLDDTRNMIRYARGHRRAVVVGGGPLGLEAARGLQNQGLDITVVHSAAHLMDQQLGARAGLVLRHRVAGLGIGVELGARPVAVLGQRRVRALRLADGRDLPCDMVVVAAGVRPDSAMARASGLIVQRGIVVDDRMRAAGERDIYAVGACAEHRGQVYGAIRALWEQAEVLSDHITGSATAAYHGSRISTRLTAAGVDVVAMGAAEPEWPEDEYAVTSSPRLGVHRSVVVREGRLIGAALVGDVRGADALIRAYDERLPVADDPADLLFAPESPP
ncbi:NAD(P)/FAD-dependent oxidoreductase [Actinocorallia aurea]